LADEGGDLGGGEETGEEKARCCCFPTAMGEEPEAEEAIKEAAAAGLVVLCFSIFCLSKIFSIINFIPSE